MILLTHLATEISAYNARAAGPVRREALQLAYRVHYRGFVAETLLDLADYHIVLAEYGPAMRRLKAAQAEFVRLNDQGGVMRCLGRFGKIADQEGRYTEALAYCFKGLEIEAAGDLRRFNTSLKIQVSIYIRMREYDQAKPYLVEALRIARYFDYPDRINLALRALGELSCRQGQWGVARLYYQQSIAISQHLANQPEVLTVKLNLAEVNEQLSYHADASVLGHSVLQQAEAANQLLTVLRAQVLLARVCLSTGYTDSAIWYGRRSLHVSRQDHYQQGARDATQILARAYAQRHNYVKAYQAQQQFIAYNDSLMGTEVARRTAALQFKYELSRKQAQIQLLTKQQQLDHLLRQRHLAGKLGLGLLALLTGGLLWLYRRQQRRRENALRTRLATHLHDDVGTLLSQISLQSRLLQG
ncbi:tetratricopeptide repeat protein [Hymenobacter cavernae]|uniref:Tetratricopeptide repeat protein n=1 Tax=Hymenobacter cavernae TaxID=2044852 RepID=A0ABQ1UMF0_9BACT|nr:tetratricopeptide repeat protein [Hymenobacter cavernae]GGF21832.1 hypothetical protein GCM10011383_36820 [Hymenobacter cavernae]